MKIKLAFASSLNNSSSGEHPLQGYRIRQIIAVREFSVFLVQRRHLIIGDKDSKVITVLPSDTKAFPTVLYGQTAMIDDIIAAGRGKGL